VETQERPTKIMFKSLIIK